MFGRSHYAGIDHVFSRDIERTYVGKLSHRVPSSVREANIESVAQSNVRPSGRQLRGFPGGMAHATFVPINASLRGRKSPMRAGRSCLADRLGIKALFWWHCSTG
jgi:hypothetical protein